MVKRKRYDVFMLIEVAMGLGRKRDGEKYVTM
jgi:hypothetical protein